MLQPNDIYIFALLIVLLLFILIAGAFRRVWSPIQMVDADDEVVQILKEAGYITIRRKIRIPITILSQKEKFESRYFIDAIAIKDGMQYVVRMNRPRDPLTMSGSSIRDQLLPYYLLGKFDGALFVDADHGKVQSFSFELDKTDLPKNIRYTPYILTFIAGFLIASLLF